MARSASEKSAASRKPGEAAPGRWTVILEPSAVLDLVGFLFYDFAGTAMADQRSCFNKRMGKKVLGENITLHDDAYHPLQSGAPFDGEGIPRQKILLVDKGVPCNLVYSRASAKKMKAKPTGHGFSLPNDMGEAPMNLVFGGGKASVDEMVRSTERGILVTRLWYIRDVDPYEKVLTGMTRDGTFLVQDGKVAGGVRNFRFNQGILEMLSNVEMMGPAVRAAGEESFEMVVPPMKVREFSFLRSNEVLALLLVVPVDGLLLQRFSSVQQAVLAGDKFLEGPIRVVPVNRASRPGFCECFGVVECPVDLQPVVIHAPHAPHSVQGVTVRMACPIEPGDVF